MSEVSIEIYKGNQKKQGNVSEGWGLLPILNLRRVRERDKMVHWQCFGIAIISRIA